MRSLAVVSMLVMLAMLPSAVLCHGRPWGVCAGGGAGSARLHACPVSAALAVGRGGSSAEEATSDDDDDDEEEKARARARARARKRKKKAGGSAKKPARPSAEAQKHLSTNLKSSSPNYRIQKELKAFLTSPPPNLRVKVGKNLRLWIVTFRMPEDTIYAGEKFRLRVQFPASYPTDPPSVFFLSPTPKHEHVYTNGDICLSLLGKDWRPTMTAQSLAISIMSILSGARQKSIPMDNARHAPNKPGQIQKDWVYHDDNC